MNRRDSRKILSQLVNALGCDDAGEFEFLRYVLYLTSNPNFSRTFCNDRENLRFDKIQFFRDFGNILVRIGEVELISNNGESTVNTPT